MSDILQNAGYIESQLKAYRNAEKLEMIERSLKSKAEGPSISNALWAEGKQIEDLYNLRSKLHKLPSSERRDNFLTIVENAIDTPIFTTEQMLTIEMKDTEIKGLKHQLQVCLSDMDTLISEKFELMDQIYDLRQELQIHRDSAVGRRQGFMGLWR